MGRQTIGAGIKLDGETEFKKAISGINSDMRVLASEMKKVTTEFYDNKDSLEALTAKDKALNDQLEKQKEKIDAVKKALENSKTQYGENSEKTKRWQITLNDAESQLNKLNTEIKQNKTAMDNAGKETAQTTDKVEKFTKETNQAADKTDKFGDKLKSTSSRLGSGFASGLKVAMVGVAALGAAMTVAVGSAIKSTAEIQQSLGGVEAVFGKNSTEVKKWAAESAGAMGLSANAALETANKMGSLFQGSGIEAGKASEMTMKMSQRAADVASVMGVDLSMAMESVTGAAKGNYTMMDNLGVAMNETTLSAYAQSKGIDTAWKSMSTAEKNGIAYQLFMEKTQKYAGNFAKENTTLAGSFEFLKGSFQNVMSSLSDPDMLKTSMTQFVTAIRGAVKSVGDILPQLVSGLMDTASTLLPILVPIMESAISTLVKMIPTFIPMLIDGALSLIKAFITIMKDNGPLLIKAGMDAILSLVNGMLEMLPDIVKLGLDMIVQLALGIADALPELIPTIVSTVLTIVDTLIANIDKLIDASIAIMMALADGIIAALPLLLDKLPEIIDKLVIALVDNLPKLIEMGIKFQIALAKALIKAIPELVKAIPEIIGSIVTGFGNMTENMLDIGKNLVSGIWDGILRAKDWLLDKIKGFGGDVMTGIKDFFGIKSPSSLMRDQVGKNLALGLGEGFSAEMKGVSDSMNKKIPKSFEMDMVVNSRNNAINLQSNAIGASGGGMNLDSFAEMIKNSVGDLTVIVQAGTLELGRTIVDANSRRNLRTGGIA
jgi:phage-related protein